MSKFKLRNLMNERRRIDKEIEKVKREMEKGKDKTIYIGIIDETLKGECSVEHRGGKQVMTGMEYNFRYIFTRRNREVACTLYCADTKITVQGKSICCDEDVFILEKGMKLAEARAKAEYYARLVEIAKKDL